ncbi:hypothetical protein GRZ55_11665 [Chelativorans sp. ZYF759]|uniref:hypothetical protein n=1 Tax=Chelativorans sp. ZYF759 TaxID=2692213 RepID=UPI00145E8CFE|nr:hypothetical protein [Chelativorans sp. ZYF759]NMG39901.1 hypothetical protein [Chelativorans sp. ZYF759]
MKVLRTSLVAAAAAFLAFGAVPSLGTQPGFAQSSFTCPWGKRAACLDYGDKVVDSNSTCFNHFTCNFRGFVCKSTLEELADECERLRGQYNDLVRRFNNLQSEFDDAERKIRQIRSCVDGAYDLDDAKVCLW